MKHPKPGSIRAAMQRLEMCLDEYDRPVLTMSHGDITDEPGCETVACHGGWYAMATSDFYWANDGIAKRGGKPVSYSEGADQLATDLGFSASRPGFHPAVTLKQWAHENPTQWGNEFGLDMFRSDRAFENLTEGPVTVYDVIAHWMRVADRIEGTQS